MPLLTSFLTLNPEVEKLNYVNTKIIEKESDIYVEEVNDLKSTYLLADYFSIEKSELLKNQIKDLFETSNRNIKISSDVLAQCYCLIENLYPSVLDQLEMENVYSTPYGTVVFDWEKDPDNAFSLEIGAKELGYFIEVNGKDIKQVDSLILDESKNELLEDLSTFLSV